MSEFKYLEVDYSHFVGEGEYLAVDGIAKIVENIRSSEPDAGMIIVTFNKEEKDGA